MCGLGTERLGGLWCLLFYSVVSSKGAILVPRATKPTCTNYTLSFSLCSPIVSVMSCCLKAEKVNSIRQSLARF